MAGTSPAMTSVRFCPKRHPLAISKRRIEQELDVEHHDRGGDDPRQDHPRTADPEGADLLAIGHEQNQRDDRERKLHRQDHLAEDQELAGAARAQSAVMITTGTMAMARVISRRIQGGSRMWRKPSITICPASVPVIVELKPAASKAVANSTEAKPT